MKKLNADINKFCRESIDCLSFSSIKTGIKPLDKEMNGGLRPGLTVLGAVPGTGKSTLAYQIALNISSAGTPVLIYSLEMSRNQILAKLISRQTFKDSPDCAVSAIDILNSDLNRKFTASQWKAVENAASSVGRAGGNIHITESADHEISAAFISGEVKNFISENPGAQPVVIVDYLQILAPDPRHSANDKQATDDAIRTLSALASSCKISILLISSLNRTSYDKELTMMSFKETGSIEYSADMLIGMETASANGGKDGQRVISLKFLKQRYGRNDVSVELDYIPKFDCFEVHKPADLKQENGKSPETGSSFSSGIDDIITVQYLEKQSDQGDIAYDIEYIRDNGGKVMPEDPVKKRRAAVKLSKAYINPTKIAADIRNNNFNDGGTTRELLVGNAKREENVPADRKMTVKYRIRTPKDEKPEFTYFDFVVSDALYSIKRSREETPFSEPTFTLGEVVRLISGNSDKTVTETKKTAVRKSIGKLSRTFIEIDYTNEAKSRRLPLDQNGFAKIQGQLVRLRPTTRDDAFTFAGNMLLYEYAEAVNQMICYPTFLISKDIGNSTIESISIKHFLIKRLELIRNPNNSFQSHEISLHYLNHKDGQKESGLMPEIGICYNHYSVSSWNKKKHTVCETVTRQLDELKKEQYIFGYAIEGERAPEKIVLTSKTDKDKVYVASPWKQENGENSTETT